MTTFIEQYAAKTTVDPSSQNQAVDWLFEMSADQATPEYDAQMFLCNADGSFTDITDTLVYDTSSDVEWDSTSKTPASARFETTANLTWGLDQVVLYQLIRSVEFNIRHGFSADTYVRFSFGRFVVTSPGYSDLDAHEIRSVTGYGINYLLQIPLNDAIAFAGASTYAVNIRSIFRKLGIVGGSGFLSDVCDYPQDYATKALTDPISYPNDGSMTALDIINDQLNASGMRSIYPQPNGRWLIEPIPKVSTQATLWDWAGSESPDVTDDDLDHKIVLMHQASYTGDVWGAPNRWVFIQDGLTFEPVEGSGQFTVNNTTVGPSDQVSVGRVVPTRVMLTASGQADLVTQGNAIVADALSQVEKISIRTRAWPAARHFDVFRFTHEALPIQNTRKLQAQTWTTPLFGDYTQWTTNVVASL